MLHYKACARTWKAKAGDIALMAFGSLAAVYTTVQTIKVGGSLFLAYSSIVDLTLYPANVRARDGRTNFRKLLNFARIIFPTSARCLFFIANSNETCHSFSR